MTYLIPNDEEPDSPGVIARRLIVECEEFGHLLAGEANIKFLFDLKEVIQNGKKRLGEACMPKVQGRLKGVFEWMLARTFPGENVDFLIILDEEYWLSADSKYKEILIYHELCHCIQKTDPDGDVRFDGDGRPVWGLLAHDVEEFSATVARYGAYSDEIKRFIKCAGGVL